MHQKFCQLLSSNQNYFYTEYKNKAISKTP